MYESFFGLTHRPFSAAPDASCFFACETTQHVLEELTKSVLGGQGIGIMTAPAGMGKTLLCKKLAETLEDSCQVVYLPNSNFPTRRSLLQSILYELGHPYCSLGEQELRLELTTAIRELPEEKELIALIVDEAHILSNRLLEELRTLTNLSENGSSPIRLVLSGQLVLEEKLTEPELADLNQRVCCQVYLEPLSRYESVAYLEHRIRLAGQELETLFTQEAVEIIAQVSDGSPRCLNQLADHAFLLGYVSEDNPISELTVREALDDLKQLPLHWNEPTPMLDPIDQIRAEAGLVAEDSDDLENFETDDADFETAEIEPTEGHFIEDEVEDEPEVEDFQPVDSDGTFEVGAEFEVGSSEVTDSVIEHGLEEIAEREEEFVEEDEHSAVFEVSGESEEEAQVEDGAATYALDDSESAAFEVGGSEDPQESIVETMDSIMETVSSLSSFDADSEENPTAEFQEEEVIDRYAELDAISENSPAEVVYDSAPVDLADQAVTSEEDEQSIEETLKYQPEETQQLAEEIVEFESPVDEAVDLVESALQFDSNSEMDQENTVDSGIDEVSGNMDVINSNAFLRQNPRPDEIIDELLPLLEGIDDLDEDSMIVTSEFLSDGDDAEDDRSSDASLPAANLKEAVRSPKIPLVLDTQSQLIAEILNGTDIEEDIGAEVLDVCIDTQQLLHGSVILDDSLFPFNPPHIEAEGIQKSEPEAFADSIESNSEIDEPVEYDVVEPETVHLEESQSQAAEGATHPAEDNADPPVHYQRLFSELRRKQRRA